VRFSSVHGQYAITHISENGAINHNRISHKLGEGFLFRNQYFPTIAGLIEAISPVLKLTKACPGSKYQSIFQNIGTDYQYKNCL
jgi:hypothetical protein